MQTYTFDQFSHAAAPAADAGEAVSMAELEALRQAAVAEGFEAGRQEALASLGPAAGSLDAAAAALAAESAALAERLEAEAVALAIAVAERIVAGTVAVRPELVIEAVRGALRGIADRSRLTVLVHPDDLDLVREAAGAMADQLGGIEHLDVQAERRVGRGGAVVRHPEGDVDAQPSTKLDRVRELFEGLS